MTREELFNNLKTGARWDVGVSINRSNSLPLDPNSIFESYAAAAAYASKDATRIAEYGFLNNAYIGQVLAVIEDKVVGEETVTTVGIYYIDANLTLQPVGKEVIADGNSIVNDNGTIKLYGFEAAGTATYPRKTADGKIEWVTINELIEGAAQNTITTGDNVTIKATGSVTKGYTVSLVGADAATNGQVPFYNVTETPEGLNKSLVWKDVYTKAEVDAKIAGLLTYKGTAHHVSENLEYIFVTEDADGIKADSTNLGHVYIIGDREYVSNGSKWEELGYTIETDLSNYYTKEEADTVVETEKNRAIAAENELNNKITTLTDRVDIIEDKGFSTNDFTDELLSKLNDIEVGAQVNDIEIIKIVNTELPIFDKCVNIPMATIDNFGVVIGSTKENKVAIGKDGTMEVNSINVDKLIQTEGSILILNGGSSVV